MRLHHLSVTAFGPFVDTAEVDFDALSAAGLFLLTGATGAGKTSVLDAVCFALYGDVPGDRSVAKRLRADQAPPDLVPRVVLEVTLAGRRFRIVRSPAWQRPKKRGSGTTPQQATVTLTELLDGEQVHLSSRLDEVGDLVLGLVGMTMPQFCQVAMLPQGGFQAFLRARADERQAVLQQLFHTARFSRVEGWLRDRRLHLHRTSRHQHDEVVARVNRLSEAAAVPPPEAWDLDAIESPASDGSLAAWASELRDGADQQTEASAALVPAAALAEEEARRQLEEATRTSHLLARKNQAQQAHRRLSEAREVHAGRSAALEVALRAAAVLPLARVTERAGWEASAARLRLLALRDEVAAGLCSPRTRACLTGADDLAGADTPLVAVRDAVRSRLEELAPLRSHDDRCDTLRRGTEQATRALTAARDAQHELEAQVAAVPPRLERLRVALASSTTLAESTEARRREREDLEARLAAHARVRALEDELATAEEGRRGSVARTQELTEVWLDLREARLHGMAAEIAGALAVGGSCPVCGSCSHPSPATAAPGAPDATAERRALREVDDAKATQLAHDERVQQVRTQLEVARSTAGDEDEEQVSRALVAAAAALREAEEAGGRAEELHAGVADLEERLDRAREELHAATTEASRLEERRDGLQRELAEVERVREEALAGTGLPDVASLVSHVQALEHLVDRAVAAETLADEAGRRAEEQQQSLARCLAEHGFDHVDAARSGHREPAVVARLRTEVERHRDEETRCLAVLAEPEVAALTEAEPPDLELLTRRHHELREELHRLRVRHEADRARSERLGVLVRELEELLERWRPLREEHRTVADLAAFVEGRSADNHLQMRLSAYVLAYRLSQVVDAANARLAGMSDQRYSLEHTGQRGNRERRGGLGLLVRDDWSGESRDPATLSGGETFVVSLALALGLADVITEEAGGADLDTLFVDEGFGSLDADTLDDVLDALDALRDRGRVVGVVSHVTEMRERIPAQLRVHKGRSGSTLSTVGL